MEPLSPCNDILGNSCQVPARCVWKTREGYAAYKEEQFQFRRKTKMHQFSFEAKPFWTALSCAFNRVYFQYLQCPWTVLFTLSPRPYSNLSSYFFCFSDFYSRTISTLNQQVNRGFLYNIHAYLLRIHPPPSTAEAMDQPLGLLLNHRGKISMNNLRLSWPKNGLAKDFTTWHRMRGHFWLLEWFGDLTHVKCTFFLRMNVPCLSLFI